MPRPSRASVALTLAAVSMSTAIGGVTWDAMTNHEVDLGTGLRARVVARDGSPLTLSDQVPPAPPLPVATPTPAAVDVRVAAPAGPVREAAKHAVQRAARVTPTRRPSGAQTVPGVRPEAPASAAGSGEAQPDASRAPTPHPEPPAPAPPTAPDPRPAPSGAPAAPAPTVAATAPEQPVENPPGRGGGSGNAPPAASPQPPGRALGPDQAPGQAKR